MKPKNLNLWTHPQCYFGELWPEWYVFLGRNRDSDALSRANFDAALKAVGPESGTVRVVRENHWACGWIEWIAIHQDDEASLMLADKIKGKLGDYPVVDEELLSQYEQEEAEQVWRECYRPKERIAYIREHASQFEFQSFRDLLGCVRGQYFAGYASELIH